MCSLWGKITRIRRQITKIEDETEACWAGVVSCGGDKKKLNEYFDKCEKRKQKILDVMKEEGKTTVEEYNEIRKWKLSQFNKYSKKLVETWEYERL